MGLWRSYDNHMHAYNRMIVCREAEVNIWTRLQPYDDCAIPYNVVGRRTNMAQHREKAVLMRTCENMVQTSATSHDVKRSHDVARWL